MAVEPVFVQGQGLQGLTMEYPVIRLSGKCQERNTKLQNIYVIFPFEVRRLPVKFLHGATKVALLEFLVGLLMELESDP